MRILKAESWKLEARLTIVGQAGSLKKIIFNHSAPIFLNKETFGHPYKFIHLLYLLFFISGISSSYSLSGNYGFDKKIFYKIISSGNVSEIDQMITTVKTLSLPERDAYEGTLLMRKAGLLKNKRQQLSLFKAGKVKLESTIINNAENCEFRLLRLIIQENAPAILGYNKQINQDCNFIRENYKTTPLLLQGIISDYSKQSKKLKLSDN